MKKLLFLSLLGLSTVQLFTADGAAGGDFSNFPNEALNDYLMFARKELEKYTERIERLGATISVHSHAHSHVDLTRETEALDQARVSVDNYSKLISSIIREQERRVLEDPSTDEITDGEVKLNIANAINRKIYSVTINLKQPVSQLVARLQELYPDDLSGKTINIVVGGKILEAEKAIGKYHPQSETDIKMIVR